MGFQKIWYLQPPKRKLVASKKWVLSLDTKAQFIWLVLLQKDRGLLQLAFGPGPFAKRPGLFAKCPGPIANLN